MLTTCNTRIAEQLPMCKASILHSLCWVNSRYDMASQGGVHEEGGYQYTSATLAPCNKRSAPVDVLMPWMPRSLVTPSKTVQAPNPEQSFKL